MNYTVLYWLLPLVIVGIVWWWYEPSFHIIKSVNPQTNLSEQHLLIWFTHCKYRNYIRIKML